MDEQQKPEQKAVTATPVKRRKLKLWEIFALIFVVIGTWWFTMSVLNAPQSTSTSNQNSAPILVSANQLMTDYANNEIAADNKYKNENLEISGLVQSVNEGILSDPYIVIVPTTNTAFSGIQCHFNESQAQELSTLNSGQSITVEGTGNGEILGEQMVENCSIVTTGSSTAAQ